VIKESPANPPRGLGGHQKQKIFFTFSDLARGRISLKWKRKFRFWCSAFKDSGSLAGLKADFGRAKQLVWEYGFCPASTDFPPASKVEKRILGVSQRWRATARVGVAEFSCGKISVTWEGMWAGL